MAILKMFNAADTLERTRTLVTDDWDTLGREDLQLLVDCVQGVDTASPFYDMCVHVLRAARSGIRKALAEGGPKAEMPWAFKGVAVLDYSTAGSPSRLADYPKLTNPDGTPQKGGWLRPSDLRKFVERGHHPIVVWLKD